MGLKGHQQQQLCRQCQRSLEDPEEDEEEGGKKKEEDEAAAKKRRRRREDLRVYATMVVIVGLAATVTLAKVLLVKYLTEDEDGGPEVQNITKKTHM